MACPRHAWRRRGAAVEVDSGESPRRMSFIGRPCASAVASSDVCQALCWWCILRVLKISAPPQAQPKSMSTLPRDATDTAGVQSPVVAKSRDQSPFEQAVRDFEEAAQHSSIATPASAELQELCRRAEEITREQIIALTPDEQLALWNALQVPTELTAAQRRLGAMMRGGR